MNKLNLNELGSIGSITNWGDVKKKNIDIYVSMLMLKINKVNLQTALIFDEDEPFIPIMKFSNAGYFENRQFLRLFIDRDDCNNYIYSPNITNALYEDLKNGQSYLNFITETGNMGSNDYKVVLEAGHPGLLGPIPLETFLHLISLELAVKSIGICVLTNDSFRKTTWFKELRQSFGLDRNKYNSSIINDLKRRLDKVWDKVTLYGFLNEYG